jgi:transposase
MAKPLVSDELWAEIEPLLPAPKPRRVRYPGRKPIDNRRALTGIVFVLKSGIPWEMLPQEMNCGSGMTCWRRLRDWQQGAGVWDALHAKLLDKLAGGAATDWSRAVVDSGSVRAVGGGGKTGPNPTDRGKPGSKHHLITDARGLPLAAILTGANAHDVTQLIPLVDAVGPVRSASKPTGRMTRAPIAGPCAAATSSRSWRGATRPTAAAWGSRAGSWSAPSPGCTSFAGCGCALSVARIFMKRS